LEVALKHAGSGSITVASKDTCLTKAPLYIAGWEALLKGNGKYVVVLGAGPATREVRYALDDANLENYQLPTIDCYDVSDPPAEFFAMQQAYPNVRFNYFPGTDLSNFNPRPECIDNTRLISAHGVLDYLLKNDAVNLLEQIAKIRPETISLRLCLTTGAWESNFAERNKVQRGLEKSSIDQLKTGHVSPVHSDVLRQSAMQLDIPSEAKVKHNLHPDYPAIYFQPHIVAGYFMSEGYNFPDFDCYDLTGRDESTSILMVFHLKK
jgi:hypothetical protein